jgi:chlorobactene glucosyltransferase
MNSRRPTPNKHPFRIPVLGALAAGLAGLAFTSLRSLELSETVPEVDALTGNAPDGGEWPLVSVIVPARNEERNLPRLLPTLLSQRYPNYEVIVVDDQSTDATPRILGEWAERDRRLHVVRGSELQREEGWLGKPHAMHQGAAAARGEWLLFTDADTHHSPRSIASSVAFALRRNIDLLTIMPCAELGPSEKMLMPVAFMGILTFFPLYKVNDPASPTAIANGQYILIRRDVYDKVGGIARVKGKIAEDLEFGKAVKHDGYRLYMADGRNLMSVRMYTNLHELWEGWSKNVVLSFVDNPGVGLFSAFAILFAVTAPISLARWAGAILGEARKTNRRGDYIAAAWAAALSAWTLLVPMAYRRRIDATYGLSAVWTLTQPLGMLIFALLLLNSTRRLLTGKGVTWKGRTYAAKAGTKNG